MNKQVKGFSKLSKEEKINWVASHYFQDTEEAKNLETKKQTMEIAFPSLNNQDKMRFPSLSCILAKLNGDDIGLHHEYLKYKTVFFRLRFAV